MIDLHIHSNNSDGSDSIVEILKKAEEMKLDYISITDHDNCDVYDELKKIKVGQFYRGNIIKGIELKCAYQGRVIDVLGYNYSIRKMKKLLKTYYPEHSVLQEKYMKNFYKACEEMNLVLTPYENLKWDSKKDWATITIFNEIKSHPENEERCSKNMWEDLEHFRYNYLYNKDSNFYIDKTSDYPNLSECIKIIHKSKGKAFLAHPYIYDWAKDKKKFLNEIIKNYKIDGIECYYTKFSEEEIDYALSICCQNNLLKSGGSDYHGTNKPGINMGEGYGNMQIPNFIIDNWKEKVDRKVKYRKLLMLPFAFETNE